MGHVNGFTSESKLLLPLQDEVPPDVIELNNPAHAMALASVLHKPYYVGGDFVISRSSGGRLLGGVVFQQYTGSAVALHIAGMVPNWMSRSLIWWTFHYPFKMLKVRKLIAAVSTGKPRSLSLAFRMGFYEEARLLDVVPDGTLVILSMSSAACSWLGEPPRNRKVIVHPGV